MLWWAIGLVLMLGSALALEAHELLQLSKAYRSAFARNAVTQAYTSARQQMAESGVWPSSVDSLATNQGFSFLRTYTNTNSVSAGIQPEGRRPFVELVASPSLADSVWTFTRYAAVSSFASGESVAEYGAASANKCPPASGDASFSTSLSWCGNPRNEWLQFETRAEIADALGKERLRQIASAGKMLAYYNANRTFPVSSYASVTLTSLTSGPASVSDCDTALNRGKSFIWNGIPFECQDLFTRWGTPVYYAWKDERAFAIWGESPFRNASGDLIRVATELNL